MSVPFNQTAFNVGEVTPKLFGHTDLARFHAAASTMRNVFVGYQGGAYSRAGTLFVGFSKQTGRSFPPRLITFQFSINQGLALEFGNNYMRVISDGAFVTESPVNITTISNANPGVLQMASDAFATGDWVFITGVGGMTQVNGETYILTRTSSAHYTLHDVYGNGIDTTTFGTYTSGGTAARIYTLATIYAETDLPYLKFTQSADVMSLCCVNQTTGTEYPPQDLSRTADDNWSFSPAVPVPSIGPPTNLAGTASTTGTTDYNYAVTAISPADGTESVASNIADVGSAVDIAATAGTIFLSWDPVATASAYNVYKTTPGYGGLKVPTASALGFIGLAVAPNFNDSNSVSDFSQVPPTHQNPFARGAIISVTVTAGGSGYNMPPAGYTLTTATGSGAVLLVVIGQSAAISAVIVISGGQDYKASDTITITGGGGTGATATLNLGAQSGTYPSVPSYFQERRAYANSLNNPDTYWMSQPGAFLNFDVRQPTIDSDAITGSPWSLEVNGIQWMVPTSGGLLVLTGLSAWLLVGTGSFATNVQPISPSNQVANSQPSSGCSALLPPIKINYDVIYVQAKGSFYLDLPYQLYALSEPIDLTENSSHLFVAYTIKEHAWCEQPYKVLWAIRNDGIMLSVTFYKTQQVAGWARHDTNGFFVSCCSVTEPPVDALYVAAERFPANNTAYMIERMNNRIWSGVEDCFCVDCGLSLPQPSPNAILNASSATGLGACTGVTGLIGGTAYSPATTATVIDAPMIPNGSPGPGVGAVPALTISGGAVATVTFAGGQQGSGYLNPQLVITDPENTGNGASARITLDNTATFLASSGVFSGGDVGKVIRMGGGIAKITAYTDSTHVQADILSPMVALIPNSGGIVAPQLSGTWTMTAPVTTISGLNYLTGATVTGLADGNVITPRVVSAQGTITLDQSASAVTVGLGFQAQLQSVYLDTGTPTVQGQRKKVAAVTARIENSRGLKIGSNQPDGSTQSPIQIAPAWSGLVDVPDDGPNFPLKPYNALATPLRTGDIRIPVGGGFATPGQVAVQQDNPLPMNILSFISDVYPGDTAQVQEPKRGGKGG